MFFRSLLPNFDPDQPLPAEGAAGGGAQGAELRNSVNSLLDAMRDLLGNLQLPEVRVLVGSLSSFVCRFLTRVMTRTRMARRETPRSGTNGVCVCLYVILADLSQPVNLQLHYYRDGGRVRMLALARAVTGARGGLKEGQHVRLNLRSFIRSKATESENPNSISFNVGGTKQNYTVIDVQKESFKFYNAFHTVRGQRAVGGLWITASFLAFVYHTVPHTLAREWVKTIYQHYTGGNPTNASKKMVALVNEVIVDLGADKDIGKGLELFALTLDEPGVWGEPGGALLGYPQWWHWTMPSQVVDIVFRIFRLGPSSSSSSAGTHHCDEVWGRLEVQS